MKKYISIIAILFVTSIVLMACSSNDNPDNQAASENNNDNGEKTHSSADNNEKNNDDNSQNDDSDNQNNNDNAVNDEVEDTTENNDSQPVENAEKEDGQADHSNNKDQNDPDTSENEAETPELEIYDSKEIFVGQGRQGMEGDYSKVQENLELPYIYKNTKVYSGTINPDQTITFEVPQKNGEDTQTVQPDVSEEGRFTLPLFNVEWDDEGKLHMFIKGGMPHEAPFELPIQPEEDEMDIVPKNRKAIDAIEEETYLPDFYANTNSYYGKTVPNAEVTVIESDMGDTMEMEVDEDGNFSGSDFANFPYVAKGKANLQEGDTLLFLITDENGHSTYIEKEILARSDDPDYTEPVSPEE